MTDRRVVRDRLVKALLGVSVSVALALVGWATYELYRDTVGFRANAHAYDELQVGMSDGELAELREGTPDCVVRIRNSRAVYYWPSRSHFITGGMPDCPATVSDSGELPRKYASLQVLLDENGTVYAVGLEGEAGLKTTHTLPGASEMLRQLPNDYVR